jgi:hypothetical protein
LFGSSNAEASICFDMYGLLGDTHNGQRNHWV